MGEFDKKLAKLAKNWKKATEREDEGFGSNVEDGFYRARLTTLELAESQSSGRLQVVWGWTIKEGEFKGEEQRDYDGLETEDNLFFLQRKLAKLGVEEMPDDPSELEAILKKLAKSKPEARIQVKSKNDFTHVYINKLVDGDESDGEDEPEEGDEESEEETAKPAKGKKGKKEAEEPEEVALEQGMKVSFEFKGEEMEGEILEFTDGDTKARVKTEDRTVKVAIEKLTPVKDEESEEEDEESEDEEDEKPKGKKGKKEEENEESEEESEDEESEEEEDEEDEKPKSKVKKSK